MTDRSHEFLFYAAMTLVLLWATDLPFRSAARQALLARPRFRAKRRKNAGSPFEVRPC